MADKKKERSGSNDRSVRLEELKSALDAVPSPRLKVAKNIKLAPEIEKRLNDASVRLKGADLKNATIETITAAALTEFFDRYGL